MGGSIGGVALRAFTVGALALLSLTAPLTAQTQTAQEQAPPAQEQTQAPQEQAPPAQEQTQASEQTPPAQPEKCDLASRSGSPIAAEATTRFVPNGGIAQVLLDWPIPASVRVFEVEPEDLAKPVSSKPIVTSAASAGTDYDTFGYTAEDSVLEFIVPQREQSPWQRRAFIIRLCGKADAPGAWALLMPRVSPPVTAIIISILVIAVLYVAFASIVYQVRNAGHGPKFEAKWPAYKKQRDYTWIEHLDPVVLTANALNKGSIQKLQVLVFTMVVGGMVLALVLTSGFLPAFSPTVAMLLGISAVGAAVAQKTTTSGERIQFDNWAWLVKRQVLPITRHQEDSPRWSDLVTTGREFDIYKLQTLLFSGVVAVALLANGGNALQSFAVPETLLGILGLSQVVYIAGSLVRPPSISELDKAVTELREMEAKVATALTQNTDTDSEGKLLPTTDSEGNLLPLALPAGGVPAKNAKEQYSKKADQVEIMLESTLETDINRKKLDYAPAAPGGGAPSATGQPIPSATGQAAPSATSQAMPSATNPGTPSSNPTSAP